MTRETRKSAAKPKVVVKVNEAEKSSPSKYKIMILPKSVLDDDNASILKLRNPKTGTGECYLFDDQNQVYQLKRFFEEPRSWFVDDSVQQDGAMVFTTVMDPLFLILAYFKEDTRFQPLDQILVDNEFPDCSRLLSVKGLENLDQVSDMKESGDLKAYRYNQTKCMEWLANKVNALAKTLKEKGIHVSSGSQAATFMRSKKEPVSENDYVKYAHGLISDYLSESISKALQDHMGIVIDKEDIKETAEEPPSKRAKVEGGEGPVEDYSKADDKANEKKEPQKLTTTQKALKKVDKAGIKSISSFFGRLPKR